MKRSPRRFVTLLPALLCAIWSLILVPPAPAPATVEAASATSAPARAFPAFPAASSSVPATPAAPGSPHLTPPEPHLAAGAVVGLPAAVENHVRFPGAPVAPDVAPVDVPVPVRGVLVGDPRRERAPPGGSHRPRDPRGPPSPRHD
ncbi:hypothetical protein ACFVZH_33030 [Streptomyces sp. NPDC059534]|uniref:hypothetical protein n=1 Tax=Streptomyces sp. NPDC059534 TaxID=3346859 RepID=UPI0036A90B20